MDFRFKYRRGRKDPAEIKEEVRQERDLQTRVRGLAIGMSIPASLVAGPVGGYFLGRLLADWLHAGYWVPIMVILGTVSGLVMVIEMLVHLGKES